MDGGRSLGWIRRSAHFLLPLREKVPEGQMRGFFARPHAWRKPLTLKICWTQIFCPSPARGEGWPYGLSVRRTPTQLC